MGVIKVDDFDFDMIGLYMFTNVSSTNISKDTTIITIKGATSTTINISTGGICNITISSTNNTATIPSSQLQLPQLPDSLRHLVKKAKQLKQQGNEYFKQNNLELAIQSYYEVESFYPEFNIYIGGCVVIRSSKFDNNVG